jgi:hypothetical protein
VGRLIERGWCRTITMTDTSDLKAKVNDLVAQVRAELAQRLDQLLDELGALIDGQPGEPDIHPKP